MAANRIDAAPPAPRPAGLAPMETVEGAARIAERYAAHLADESRLAGRAERLAFPLCEADVAEVLRGSGPVTVASGRTGIVGGAVPEGGTLLSLERMDALVVEADSTTETQRHREKPGAEDEDSGSVNREPGTSPSALLGALSLSKGNSEPGFVARCGPGLTLARLGEELARREAPLFLPPNPTETTAQVGGAVAANASGSRSYRWGAVRRYVRALRVVLAGGTVLAVRRGECLAGPGGFEVGLPSGEVRRVPLPGCAMPAVKNAAGYWSAPGMDLVDLFVGSEGTLGVIAEATLALEPLPASTVALLGFFPDETAALGFVRAVREFRVPSSEFRVQATRNPEPGTRNQNVVQALEYFDGASLALLAEKRAEDGPGSAVPAAPADAGAAVLVELAGSGADTEAGLEALAELLTAHGADPETAWAGLDARERARLAAFRHALPEAVNSLIGRAQREHPGLTKVGTDMAVPVGALDELLADCRARLDAAGLRHVVFGHIGDGHLHVNVLPRDMAEYRRARELYLELAGRAVALGGTVSAEHGIGKLKKRFLELLYGPEGLAGMRAVKRALDPDWRLGPGTLFDP